MSMLFDNMRSRIARDSGCESKLKLCREMKPLLLNDIELSWKLHLLEHLFQIFTYKYGIVVTF